MNKAGLDTDFLNHITEIRKHPDLYTLVCNFFTVLDVAPSMHSLVYEKEVLTQNEIKKRLFNEGVIGIQSMESIWKSKPGGKRYYEMMVRQLYRESTGQDYPCADVCKHWKARQSLGEIHTLVMCAFLGWTCLLSDDKGAKTAAEIAKSILATVEVKSRKDCYELLQAQPTLPFTPKELKRLTH